MVSTLFYVVESLTKRLAEETRMNQREEKTYKTSIVNVKGHESLMGQLTYTYWQLDFCTKDGYTSVYKFDVIKNLNIMNNTSFFWFYYLQATIYHLASHWLA